MRFSNASASDVSASTASSASSTFLSSAARWSLPFSLLSESADNTASRTASSAASARRETSGSSSEPIASFAFCTAASAAVRADCVLCPAI